MLRSGGAGCLHCNDEVFVAGELEDTPLRCVPCAGSPHFGLFINKLDWRVSIQIYNGVLRVMF